MRLEERIRRMLPIAVAPTRRERAIELIVARAREILAAGESIAIVSRDEELTTGQAARILGVSRQYVVRLVTQGRLPARRTGKHRRLRAEDVLGFKERRESAVRAEPEPVLRERPSRSAAMASERERRRIAALSPRERVLLALRLGRRNRAFAAMSRDR